MLTGRVRKGRATDLRRATLLTSSGDERRLDVVEQLVPLADEAGLRMTHLAMAFVITHPAVTSALIGPRTMDQLDDLLAGSTSGSPTTSWTASTRSSRRARTSARPTSPPTHLRPCCARSCAADPMSSAPPPDPARLSPRASHRPRVAHGQQVTKRTGSSRPRSTRTERIRSPTVGINRDAHRRQQRAGVAFREPPSRGTT
jgi:Aldo/keto reductase family